MHNLCVVLLVVFLNALYFSGCIDCKSDIVLGVTYSLTGANQVTGVAAQEGFRLCVETANRRGGVRVAGNQYNLTLVDASDDSSTRLVQLSYEAMAQDPSIDILLSPGNSSPAKAALLATKKYSNKTIFITSGKSASLWNTGYKYAVGTGGMPQAAAKGLFESIEKSNLPILQMAIFYRLDSFSSSLADWAKSECATTFARWNCEVVIFFPLTFPVDGISDEIHFANSFAAMPAGQIDFLVVCGLLPDSIPTVRGLRLSKADPKLAYFTNALDPVVVAEADNWLLGNRADYEVENMPGALFTRWSNAAKALLRRFPSAIIASGASGGHISSLTVCDLLLTALNTTASLSPDDIRNALLLINGTTVGGPFAMHPTGFNMLDSYRPAQVIKGELININDPNEMFALSPSRWDWLLLRDQDNITAKLNASPYIVAVIQLLLGCWTALILVEQTLYTLKNQRKAADTSMTSRVKATNSMHWSLWLLLSTCSLSVAAIWCALFVCFTGFSFEIPAAISPTVQINYSLNFALVTLLPIFALTWSSLFLLTKSVKSSEAAKFNPNSQELMGSEIISLEYSTTASAATSISPKQEIDSNGESSIRQALGARTATRNSRHNAIFSHKDHFVYLKARLDWFVVLGGAILSGAIITARFLFQISLELQAATYKYSVAAEICLAIFLLWPMITVAMLVYFHAIRLRVVGGFTLTLAIIIYFHLTRYSTTYYYSPYHNTVLDSKGSIDPTLISIITSVISGLTCVIFIGLQFNQMQLSRNSLALQISRMEMKLTEFKLLNSALKADLQRMKSCSDNSIKALELINSVRPFNCNSYSIANSLSTNSEILQLQYEHQSINKKTARNSIATSSQLVTKEDKRREKLLLKTQKLIASYEDTLKGLLSSLEGKLPKPIDSSLKFHMKDLLFHPVCLELLKDLCAKQLCVESVLFIKDCSKYWLLQNNYELRQKHGMFLFQTYIEQNSPQQINVAMTMFEDIHTHIKNNQFPVDLFAAAEKEIYHLLHANLMSKIEQNEELYQIFQLILQKLPLQSLMHSPSKKSLEETCKYSSNESINNNMNITAFAPAATDGISDIVVLPHQIDSAQNNNHHKAQDSIKGVYNTPLSSATTKMDEMETAIPENSNSNNNNNQKNNNDLIPGTVNSVSKCPS
jgi:hypothetical protein